jgi:hypothetical protein
MVTGGVSPPRPGVALTVLCDDVEATVRELRSRDVSVGDTRRTPWGTSAELFDPDGQLLVLGGTPAARS